jgi:HEAT repeat protein
MPHTQQKGFATKLREDSDLVDRLLHRPSLVFIDQFEELFTTVHESLRAPFVDLLERMIAVDDLRIVITVRGDFYGRCIEMQTLARLVDHSTVPLSAPGAVALSDMITRPAARAALTFESGLADRILEDTGHEPGALALMAYMLDEIYRHRLGLTHAAYEELGGVQGAIGKRSESVFCALGDDERAALPRVFRELVEVDDRGSATRLRAPLSHVAATPSARALTEALTEARLLVQSRGENHESVVEVAHEALFRSWSRLAEWIADAADDLRLLHQVRRAVADWDRSGRRDDFLWSHERLAPVYSLRERLGEEFDQTLTAFIRPESERLAERIRTDTRDFRQRTDVERLIEIGAPAARALVQSLQYATTEATQKAIANALLTLRDAAVPPLLEASAADSFANRRLVLDSLLTLNALPDKEVVRRLMDDQSAAVRATAIHLAAVTADVAAVPMIVRHFDDRDPDVRLLAVLAVAAFDDDQAFEALTLAFGHVELGRLALNIAEYLLLGNKLDLDLSKFRPSVRTIVALVEKNRRAIPSPRLIEAVSAALASPAFTRSTGALRILARIGNMTALRAALTALRSNTKDVLSLISTEAGPEFISTLIGSLDAPEPYVRKDAADLVRHMFFFSERLRAIVEARSKDDLTPRLLRLARDEHRTVTKAALSALSALRSVLAAPLFREHIADDYLRLVSIEGLGRTGDSSDFPALTAALRDPRRRFQMTAMSALQEIGGQKEVAAEALSLLERIEDSPGEGSFQAKLIPIVMAAPPPRAAAVLKRIANSKGASHVAAAALAKLLASPRQTPTPKMRRT